MGIASQRKAGQAPPRLLHAAGLAHIGRKEAARCPSPVERYFDGRIAQLVEQLTLNQRVHGSSPCAPTIEVYEFARLFGKAKIHAFT